jgi:hypothetical protein
MVTTLTMDTSSHVGNRYIPDKHKVHWDELTPKQYVEHLRLAFGYAVDSPIGSTHMTEPDKVCVVYNHDLEKWFGNQVDADDNNLIGYVTFLEPHKMAIQYGGMQLVLRSDGTFYLEDTTG